MKKQDVIRKLTSRKLWLSIANFVSMMMIYNGSAESEAAQISALIMAGAGVVAYVVAEGLADGKTTFDVGEVREAGTGEKPESDGE